MIVKDREQMFNLINTNGRRADVIEAYRIYLEVIQDLEAENYLEFSSFPSALTQFRFYQEAIERSPDVFKVHTKYDLFMDNLEGNYKKYFFDLDKEKFSELDEGGSLLQILDVDIEARARHYTSNLVKIGFTDDKRNITESGKSFVNVLQINRDDFEQFLPIKDSNLIFLRQLMKLRIYTHDKARYYSPALFAIHLLINNERISTNNFKQMIQLVSPYKPMYGGELKEYINLGLNGKEGELISFYQRDITENAVGIDTDGPFDKETFKKLFKNRKSGSIAEKYYKFYCHLLKYRENQNHENFTDLVQFYENNKSNIDAAFSYGITLFNLRGVLSKEEFEDKNEDNLFLHCELVDLNWLIYSEFQKTKTYISLLEYADTLMRLLGVSGIIQSEQGIVNLVDRGLWILLDELVDFESRIFGESNEDDYAHHEGALDSTFSRNLALLSVYEVNHAARIDLVNSIKVFLGVDSIEDGRKALKNRLNEEFKEHIETNYPRGNVVELLKLFADRDNDREIKKRTKSDATIPTVFEYVCGIALYHISGADYNVLDSFNLIMNADFIPETHAGPGDGDIIARYDEKTIMLEVTLMNKQAQKRGEWEPVLRHAANLVIDELPRPVYTLFIADEFDDNTINIWRAVATVPLKSSREVSTAGLAAENVKILPITGNEFAQMIENDVSTESICESMNDSFKPLINDFDVGWRDEIISSIVGTTS